MSSVFSIIYSKLEGVVEFIPFPKVLVLWEMQSASSRVWTQATVSISYDDNRYAMSAMQYNVENIVMVIIKH